METKDMKVIGAGGLPTIGAPVSSGTGGDVVITPDVKYQAYTAASGDTSISDILPEEGEEDVIYRVGNWDGTEVDATKMSEYAWDGSDYALLRVVDSIGEVFDISAYNASGGTLAEYDDLADALGTNGANVPEGLRKGGMTVKYVRSSDNKYVQFRYMKSDAATVATFTNMDNWQGVDAEPIAGSQNLVTSGGVEEKLKVIKRGNLVRVSRESTAINLNDCPYVDGVNATTNSTPSSTFFVASSFRTYYYQVANDCKLSYKLGSADVATGYALVISDEIPASGKQYTSPVIREANSGGVLNVNSGKYICVIVYPGVPSYYPVSLSIEQEIEENLNVVEEIGEKSEDSTIESNNLWDSVEEVNSKIQNTESATPKKVPYLIESASYFWMRKQATNFNQNNPFRVSGNADSKILTILSGGQVSSVLTNDDSLAAIVIKHDDGSCTPHVLVSWTETTLEVYPAISENILNGELVPLLSDSQHLTKLGFHCWAEHLYAANPRYCEKNLYIARYAPTDTYKAQPFTQIGGGLLNYAGALNDRGEWLQRYGGRGASYYTAQDNLTSSEYGVVWDVNTGGNYKGYLEAMIGTVAESNYMNNYGFDKDEGFEMHIEVYADNELIYNYIKKTNYVERICVPFEKGQDNIKLKVYYTKLRAHKESISIDMATLWVNENAVIPQTLFPKYTILSWFMASWGEYSGTESVTVNGGLNGYPEFPIASENQGTADMNYKEYSQGASGEAMRELISNASGIQVPAYIRSKAGTTTRFGKAWWPFLVKPYNPNVMVTSFGVNDYHTNTNPGQFADVLDPYGNVIDMSEPITYEEYASNIKAMIEMCHNNDIIFIHAEGSIAQSFAWLIALENNLSSDVEQ